ncbi:Ig-like domain-containing protein [candidate division KSB1 bacterium]|nr:Ig-like domain-containing protein [candidate division KSB1 bacterium]
MNVKLLIISVLTILMICYADDHLIAQNTQLDSTANQSQVASDSLLAPANVTNINQIESFWQLTTLGGVFRWFIFLTLALGLALVVYELVILTKDRIRSRAVMRANLRDRHIDELLFFFRKQKKSIIVQIGRTLTEVFEKTGSVQGFSEEISNALKQREQQFTSFTTTINFLSDTAGALGLIGTVWGMFITFFSDTWDTTTILRGMGIALVTTLLGLIVSIILNFCSTSVHRIFNNGLIRVNSKADELRLILLAYDVNNLPESKKQQLKTTLKLVPLTEKNLKGQVNQPLEKPIAVKLVNEKGEPVSEKNVTFEVAKGDSVFDNGQKLCQIKTDANGEAKAGLLLGRRIDEGSINCFVDSLGNSKLNFRVQMIAGPPSKLKPISKELDYVPIKRRLAAPITVQLTDDFNNPIPDYPVTFITTGGGFGKRSKNNVQVDTDDNGYVSIDFISGPTAEISNVTAVAQGLENEMVEFKIMTVDK